MPFNCWATACPLAASYFEAYWARLLRCFGIFAGLRSLLRCSAKPPSLQTLLRKAAPCTTLHRARGDRGPMRLRSPKRRILQILVVSPQAWQLEFWKLVGRSGC